MLGLFGMEGLVMYVVMWGAGMSGFEDRLFGAACAEAALHKDAVVLRVTHARSTSTYAVNCHEPRCAEPPATVRARRVTCALVPERRVATETVVPEHWEEQ